MQTIKDILERQRKWLRKVQTESENFTEEVKAKINNIDKVISND